MHFAAHANTHVRRSLPGRVNHGEFANHRGTGMAIIT